MPENLQLQAPHSIEDVPPTAVDIASQAHDAALEATSKQGLVMSTGGDQHMQLPRSATQNHRGGVELREDAAIGDSTVADQLPGPDATLTRSGGNGPDRMIKIEMNAQTGNYDADYRFGALNQGDQTSNPRKVGTVNISRADGEYQSKIKSPENREKAGAIIARIALRKATEAAQKTPDEAARDRGLTPKAVF